MTQSLEFDAWTISRGAAAAGASPTNAIRTPKSARVIEDTTMPKARVLPR
jgi:hypothetical protein